MALAHRRQTEGKGVFESASAVPAQMRVSKAVNQLCFATYSSRPKIATGINAIMV